MRLALQHFLPCLKGKHIIRSGNNTPTVYHVDQQLDHVCTAAAGDRGPPG